jgi:MFS family permease
VSTADTAGPPALVDGDERLHRHFVVLSFLRWFGTGAMIPTTVVLLQDRGLSLAEIGVAAAVQSVVVLLLELPTGGLADSLGARRVLLAACAFDLLALGLFLFADTFTVVAVAWGVMGIFRALDSGPLEAWYVDRALARDPGADIERGIAHGGAAVSFGIASGALVAALLVTVGPLGGVDALVLPVVFALALRVVDAGALARLVTDDPLRRRGTREAVADIPSVVKAGVGFVRGSRALRALVLIELTWSAGMVGVESLSGPRLFEALGNPEQGVAILAVTAAVGWGICAVGAASTLRLVEWTGSPARAGALTRLVQGAAVAVMAIVAGPVGVVTGYLGFYLVHGAANAVHYGMVHRLVDNGQRTTVLSLSSLVARIGAAAADAGLGVLAATAGITPAFAVAAVLLVIGAPLYRVAGRG